MNRAEQWMRGKVRVRAEAAFPERVLNLCGANGIAFREPVCHADGTVSCTVTRAEWRRLRQLAPSADITVTIEREGGAPILLRRVRRRYLLWAGAAVLLAVIAVNSFFIRDFVVTGNENVSTEEILRVLAENGVRAGTFGPTLRPQEICNHVLPELPELSWLTVYARGCRAYVQVRERVPKPEVADQKQASNVVAAKAGLVTKVIPLDGKAAVVPGMTVQKGQLLISGVVETQDTEHPSVASRIYAGIGEVRARTWYDLSVKIPLVYDAKIPSGRAQTRHTMLWGDEIVKIFTKGCSQIGLGYDKIEKKTDWTFFGVKLLPISWRTEVRVYYETVRIERPRAEAEAMGKTVLENYLRSQVAQGGSVTARRFAAAQQGDWLLVTLAAECEEPIGQVVPIPIGED